MDGNGRWAQRRGKPRIAGHLAGVSAVRATVEACARLGLEALTLYAFSTENWKRPQTEVTFLMRLLRRFLREEVELMRRQNIRLQGMGRLTALPPAVQRDLQAATEATAAGTGMVLTLALNYGGRAEIVDACNARWEEARRQGQTETVTMTDRDLQAHLYSPHLPDPDLLIRTGGEMRISNFLLWQCAYSEIWVTPVLWPDFRGQDLSRAIEDFQGRERRYGGLAQVAGQP
jgi:undecaprenyl diphosphate synthase